ncbi:peptide-N4-asparagine amidase [Caldisphaera sp.]|uniref:peptide-N4-asparagine amidase n=1 Tax=Caldisphaera sp. TaxID=2060322 RepID=UPI0025C147F7|nr:peptide-N4-asparagine amidase [Caldisphaera sp.]
MKKIIYSALILIPLLLINIAPFGHMQVDNKYLYNNKLANITVSSSLIKKLNGNDGYYSFEAFNIMPPNVTPVVINVAKNAYFGESGMRPYTEIVNIPKGNYSLILMNVSISEHNGTQYDRAFYIFANGTPIFWGSTQEILNSTSEADLTLFEKLLSGPVEFQIVLPNYIAPKIGITGYYLVNVTLYLYNGTPPNNLPNYFIPLFTNNFGYSYTVLNPNNDIATQSIEIPNGTQKSMLLLYEEGGENDEFWYTNEPAIRNIEVYYNNELAGILNPFETIYTGGIDLFYWKPLTSINTLSFHMPYYIDLTPLLALGSNVTLSVTVSNLIQAEELMQTPYFTWDISGVLMLWVNSSNPLISGKILTMKSNLMDTQPILIPGYTGMYYQEGSSYYINYTSILNYKYGKEIASSAQSGASIAKQTFSYFNEYAFLDEKFSEYSYEKGLFNSSLSINANYPVSLYYDFFEAPITNPEIIPFNATYLQNGTISLNPSYSITYINGNYNLTESFNYNLNAIGGFSGILEIINQYGGAVLVALTNNNAIVTKSLEAIYLVNGVGFNENFYAEAIQNNTINLAGYLIKYYKSIQKVSSSNVMPLDSVSKTINNMRHYSFSKLYSKFIL